MKLAGIILIVVGILALIYQELPYSQTKEVAKIGSLEIQSKETHDLPVPPIVGGICVVVGAVLLVAGGRGK